MSYRVSGRGVGVEKFLASKTPDLCPGCDTHVSWVGVPIFRGMGVDMKRMARCRFSEEHEEMKELFQERNPADNSGRGNHGHQQS